ncbi:hypothetical protein PSPO01_05266 [Paraphaeosphaeria sporulosa]
MRRVYTEGCQNSLKRTIEEAIRLYYGCDDAARFVAREGWRTLEGTKTTAQGRARCRGGTPAILSTSRTLRTANGCVQSTVNSTALPTTRTLRIRANAHFGSSLVTLPRDSHA